MATKKIRTGDTLSSLATTYGTTVQGLLDLNKNNPSVKSRDLIISGGDLNIPDISASPTPKPSSITTPAATGIPGTSPAVPPSSFPDTGISSSLMDLGGDLTALQKSMGELFPSPLAPGSPEEKASPDYQAHQAKEAGIKSGAERSREEIQDVAAEGNLQRTRARELLGLSPAAVKSNIESFIVQSDNFDKGIARSIERLTEEENTALANEDASYASQIRQNKLDFFNLQRQMFSDKSQYLTSAFNMLLTGKQFQRQEKLDLQTQASNKLNLLLGSAGSPDQKIASLTPEEIGTLGVSPDILKQIIATPQVKFHVAKGNSVYLFDAGGNLIRSINTGGAGGGDTSTYLKSYLSGEISNASGVPTDYKDDFLNSLDIIKNDAIGNLVWNERITVGASLSNLGKSPSETKKGIADRVSQALIKSPTSVAKILGIQASISSITEDQKKEIASIVSRYVNDLIPDEYINRLNVKTKNPILNFSETSTVDAPSDVTVGTD